MSWKWPHNLQKVNDLVEACWPGITDFGIGDVEHLNEKGGSDHNADSRGLVHAVDVMTLTYQTRHGIKGDAVAKTLLAWLLTPGVRASLEYVIHDRQIYSRSSGWAARAYTGDDPHTDHVHISGKHGSTGKNTHTGTGYDTTAEAMSPAGSPCGGDEMQLTDTIEMVKQPDVKFTETEESVATVLAQTVYYVLQTRNQMNAQFKTVLSLLDPAKIADQIIAKLPTSGLTQEQVTAGVKAALADITVTLSADDAPPTSS